MPNPVKIWWVYTKFCLLAGQTLGPPVIVSIISVWTYPRHCKRPRQDLLLAFSSPWNISQAGSALSGFSILLKYLPWLWKRKKDWYRFITALICFQINISEKSAGWKFKKTLYNNPESVFKIANRTDFTLWPEPVCLVGCCRCWSCSCLIQESSVFHKKLRKPLSFLGSPNAGLFERNGVYVKPRCSCRDQSLT